MKKFINKYYGLLLGCALSVASYGLAYTFVVPIFTVMPLGVILESIAFVGHQGMFAMCGLIVVLISSIGFVVYYGLKYGLTKKEMRLVNFFEWFVIHPLGFYIYWWEVLGFRGDGQLIFGAIGTFPLSGLGFIPLGFLLTFLRRKV